MTRLALAAGALALAFAGIAAASVVALALRDDSAAPARPEGSVERALRVSDASGESDTDEAGGIAAGPALAACGIAHDAGDFVATIERPEGTRWYRLHVPASYGPTFVPLVLNFHGYARTAAEQEAYSGLVPLSEREGFVLVTPEGSGYPQGWDIPGVYADIGVDDVGFVVALIEELSAALCIDPERVFATGMSNGGQMAALLGCERRDLVAAAAPVAGLAVDLCPEPVAIITFEGTDDWNVETWLVEETFAEWGPRNGCDPDPREEPFTAGVTRRWFESCNGFDAELYLVAGGGHTWPGAEDSASSGIGFTTAEISASELMWAFFAAHPRR